MSSHRLESRQRQFKEDICVEPGCEFDGKPAQQGVCFGDDSGPAWEKIFEAGKHLADEIREIRLSEYKDNPTEYIRWLEAMYETTMMNWTSTLDECICLRVENRRLKESLAAAGPPTDVTPTK